MLYVTTRSRKDAFTAFRTLGEKRSPDGGLFVPFQIPRFSETEIASLADKTFSQSVAEILNIFFNAKMDSWDVEFTIGRYPCKVVPMSHRIFMAEMWHNPDYDFARVVRSLTGKIRAAEDATGDLTDWAWIAMRIAALFGLFAQIYHNGTAEPNSPIDIALPAEDLAGPMAVWYAREMGLPVGNIICSCADSDCLWDLLHNGQIGFGSSVRIPSDMERLIAATLGIDEANRFVDCAAQKHQYHISEEALQTLGKGLHAAVISNARLNNIISRVYQMRGYVLDPDSAMAFGGLQDYRASVGETKNAIIFAEKCPICSAEVVAKAMSISVHALKERMNLT